MARDITDPETKLERLEAAAGPRDRSRRSPRTRRRSASRADWRIGALGSGSDYTPFLQHLGVPSLNLGFGGEDSDGIYHSIYDDFYFFTHFLDTDFAYGRALAQTAGTAVIRLADADLLPFEFTNLADTVRTYVEELQMLLKKKREESYASAIAQIDDGVFAAINDPRRPRAVAEDGAGAAGARLRADLDASIETLTRRRWRSTKRARLPPKKPRGARGACARST